MASVTAVAQAYLYLVRCLRLLNSELGDAMRAIDILLLHCVPSILTCILIQHNDIPSRINQSSWINFCDEIDDALAPVNKAKKVMVRNSKSKISL